MKLSARLLAGLLLAFAIFSCQAPLDAAATLDRAVCSTADKAGGDATKCDGQELIDSTTQEVNHLYDLGIQTLGSVAGTDHITASTSPATVSLIDGASFYLQPAGLNTVQPDLAINSLPAKLLTSASGTALSAGDLQSTTKYLITYDGTADKFRVVTTLGTGAATASSAFVTVGSVPSLVNSRQIAAGSMLSGTDGGAGSTWTLAVSDAELLCLGGLTSAADQLPYFTGSGTCANTTLTSFMRTVLDDTSASVARTTLGVAIGSNVEAWDADLDCLAALSTTGYVKRTGAGTCSAGTAITGSDMAANTVAYANFVQATANGFICNNAGASQNWALCSVATSKTLLAIVRGDITDLGTNVGTALGNATNGASGIVVEDANANATVNNAIEGFVSTATAAGTTTMVVTDKKTQVWTGSTTQTVKLATTGVAAGQCWVIINISTGLVTVQSSGANTIVILASNTSSMFCALVATPTTAANWNSQYLGVVVASGKGLTVSNNITIAGTDGKTLTLSNSLTFAGTDGQTFTFPATSSNVLTTGNTATITKGYTLTPNNLGNITSFTLDPTAGNYQYGTNHAAATWTAPASDCAMTILVTNDATAGTITFSGFTVGSSTGDALTTTNTNKFLISIIRLNGTSSYWVKALQ